MCFEPDRGHLERFLTTKSQLPIGGEQRVPPKGRPWVPVRSQANELEATSKVRRPWPKRTCEIPHANGLGSESTIHPTYSDARRGHFPKQEVAVPLAQNISSFKLNT